MVLLQVYENYWNNANKQTNYRNASNKLLGGGGGPNRGGAYFFTFTTVWFLIFET